MRGRPRAAVQLLMLLVLAPLPALGIATLFGGPQPLFDYIAGYVFLLVGFGSAALPMSAYLLWRGAPGRGLPDLNAYMLLGGLGSGAFWGWFSAQDKIGEPGIDPLSVAFGVMLGVMFAAAFYWLSGGRLPVMPAEP